MENFNEGGEKRGGNPWNDAQTFDNHCVEERRRENLAEVNERKGKRKRERERERERREAGVWRREQV